MFNYLLCVFSSIDPLSSSTELTRKMSTKKTIMLSNKRSSELYKRSKWVWKIKIKIQMSTIVFCMFTPLFAFFIHHCHHYKLIENFTYKQVSHSFDFTPLLIMMRKIRSKKFLLLYSNIFFVLVCDLIIVIRVTDNKTSIEYYLLTMLNAIIVNPESLYEKISIVINYWILDTLWLVINLLIKIFSHTDIAAKRF